MLADAIKNSPLFVGVAEQDKQQLLSEGRMRKLLRKQMLFAHGEPVTHFYILTQGTIQLFRENAEGQEKTIEVLKSGQTLCESEIMDSCHGHRVNAVAVEDSELMEFPVGWLKDAARKHGAFALNLLSQIASQAHMAEIEAEHQANMSAAQLVACFLQRLCVLYDFNPKGFDLPYSKTLIASRLGMELETFSRTLNKLKEHGIILEGNHVRIQDLAKIEQYVCNFCSIAEDCSIHHTMERKNANH